VLEIEESLPAIGLRRAVGDEPLDAAVPIAG